eukprot:2947044-Pyramimonas_sp.AAC.1
MYLERAPRMNTAIPVTRTLCRLDRWLTVAPDTAGAMSPAAARRLPQEVSQHGAYKVELA